MTLNPIVNAESIFNWLKERGFDNEIPIVTLHNAITMVTGVHRGQTLGHAVKVYERLGYIKLLPNGFWKINYWKNKNESKIFKLENEEKKAKKEASTYDELIK